jgi:hypothetical protein
MAGHRKHSEAQEPLLFHSQTIVTIRPIAHIYLFHDNLLLLCSATRVSYRYHLSLSPLDGVLYISDPESHQIIRVRSTEDYSDPDHNWETAVGSGERCLPGDEAHCGDGALARDAKLAYPKGL